MTLVDTRSETQQSELTTLVVAYDKFLSKWGDGKEAGGSTAIWACADENADKVLEWVENRSDTQNVRIMDEKELSTLTGHVMIYPVDTGHPALIAR